MNNGVFISYSRKDLEEVKKIKYEIDKEVGIDCWMDLDGIESKNFADSVVKGIEECCVFLFMLSESSQKSKYVLNELNYAYHEARIHKKKVVIININGCKMMDEFILRYGLSDTILWENKSQHDKLLCDIRGWTRDKEYDVFISYSRKDSELVLSVVKQIKERGLTVWIDKDGIESGDAFKSVIVRAIKNSDVFLFFSSKASNESPWTVKEVNTAVYLKKTIIPVKLDDHDYNDSVLFDLVGLDFVDLVNEEKRSSALKKLINTLLSKAVQGHSSLR